MADDARVARLVADRVRAIMLESFSVRNGIPPVLLGTVSPAWLIDRIANCTQALLGDEFIHITSKLPEGR